MSIDMPFNGGSNETIGCRVRLQRPEIWLFWRPQGSLIRVCGVSLDSSFQMAVRMKLSSDVSDFGGWR